MAHVIAVIGSGGKTSLIRKLADELVQKKKKTAVITTTQMWIPPSRAVIDQDADRAVLQMEKDGIVYFGRTGERDRAKMVFPGEQAYRYITQAADVVLVEADGSRQLPVKYPDWRREPVIPPDTQGILLVQGMWALGQPVREVCHRWELAGLDGRLDEAKMDWLLTAGYIKPLRQRRGTVPTAVILNYREAGQQSHACRRAERLTQSGYPSLAVNLHHSNVSVIYMASGLSRRFGRNKLLEQLAGKPLYAHGLDMLQQVRDQVKEQINMEIIVVSQYQEILDYGRAHQLKTVYNAEAARGITASVHYGTKAAGRDADFYLYSVADQPWLRPETVTGFLHEYLTCYWQAEKTIGSVTGKERRGNPVIFHRRYQQELMSLTGDKGGGQLVNKYPGEVFYYEISRPELLDVDCAADLGPAGPDQD